MSRATKEDSGRDRDDPLATNRETVDGDLCAGPGALCAEAQADGVPCTERGRDCEICERAVRSRRH